MSSIADGARIARILSQRDDSYQFCGVIKTPPPHDDPSSPVNRSIALQAAAQEYFRADAHERAVFWTDASTNGTNDHSEEPEGGAEGCPTAVAVVWRQPLFNGKLEWVEDVRIYKPQCECKWHDPSTSWIHHTCTIRRAEMVAILLALKKGYTAVLSGMKRAVCVYTDCLRAIDTIRMYRATFLPSATPDEQWNWGRDLIEEIIAITNTIRALGAEVELQWIPRGVILGNKLADFQARKAIGLWPPPPRLRWDDDDTRQADALDAFHIFERRDRVRKKLLFRS